MTDTSWPLLKHLPKTPSEGDQNGAPTQNGTEAGASAHSAPSEGALLDGFLAYLKEKNLDLYPAQEEAILELLSGKNVILNTPTGSGKSMVALAVHFASLAQGRRSIYTSPIKALVNEKFFALCRDFGPEQVGMITGDGTVNPAAPIICCTAEILMQDALRANPAHKIDDVIMDEFHYYSDRDRGVAWQIPLLTLKNTRFLLMSATLGDTAFFEKALTKLNGLPTVLVLSNERPVPLDFNYSEVSLHDAVAKLITSGRAPIYLVNFTQRECAEEAQNFLSVDLCTKDEKRAIATELEGFKFSSPYGKEFQKVLKHGMGIHHASLLPKYRALVERLAQKGLLKIIFGTDTLGVGVNVPIRTVLLTKLCKYDGQKTTILSVRDFKQISGRAGRKGFDTLGTVVVQAPAHVIENLRNESKAAGDAKKLKKLVKQKPPEKGFLPWNKETFEKLVNGTPEALVSRFKINHAILLSVLSRKVMPDSLHPCDAMRALIRDCHESEHTKKQLRKTAFALFRSLVERKIIELAPLRVHADLQEDFSLNHALSLYLVDTLKLLDPSHVDYALDVLTLVESILENPDLILRKQLDQLKTIKMRELKESGVEYDQRIEELEKLEYPKPNREFIYNTFNDFAAKHPWIGQENIRPKAIARQMIEGFYSFGEYVREVDLQRAEGLLLRYLTDVYKALEQNVPEAAKNDELRDIGIYLWSQIKAIDSSLIDEWEKLKSSGSVDGLTHPGGATLAGARAGAVAVVGAGGISNSGGASGADYFATSSAAPLNMARFKVQLRNESFRVIKFLAMRDFVGLSEFLNLSADQGREIEATVSEYRATHLAQKIEDERGIFSTLMAPLFNSKARAPQFFKLSEINSELWRVQQILMDGEGHNDWSVQLEVDMIASCESGEPVLRWAGLAPI